MNSTAQNAAVATAEHEAETARLVAAIEATWRAIRAEHPDVPEVIVTIGGGAIRGGLKLGHFATDRWTRGEEGDRVHELFIGGEGLARGAIGVLGTLLHEAAHGAATVRGIQDTSRQGRFHNARFKAIGEEFGLLIEQADGIGWSTTNVPEVTAIRYARQVAQLAAAITAHRLADVAAISGKKASNNGVSAACDCGRKIRLSRSTYDAGAIVCTLCHAPFQAADDEE